MKPRLKSHVLYIDVPEGLYFELGLRNFLVKGKGLRQPVSALLRLLDGQRSLEEARAAVPETARPLLEKIVEQLSRQEMLTWELAGPSLAIDRPVPSSCDGTIDFLRDETPHWRDVFDDWRSSPLIASGDGAPLVGLVGGLLASGAARLECIVDGLDQTTLSRLSALDRDRSAIDATTSLRFIALDQLAERLEEGATLLYAGVARTAAPSPVWDAVMAADPDRTIIGAVLGEGAIVGAQLGPHITWREIISSLHPASPMPCTATSEELIGAVVAFEALKARVRRLGRLPPMHHQATPLVIRIAPDGKMSSHRLPAFGHGLIAGSGALEGEDVFPAPRLEELIDPISGIFAWEAGTIARFPLVHRAARLGRGDGRLIVGWGLSDEEALERTMFDALEAVLNRRYPAGTGEGPIVVRRGLSDWKRAAICHALRQRTLGAEQRPIDVRAIEDTDIQMLLRIYRGYFGTLPAITVRGGEDLGAATAYLTTRGAVREGVGATTHEAVFELIGGTLSDFQRGVDPSIDDPSRHSHVETGPAEPPALSRERMLPWKIDDDGLVAGRVVLA